MAGSEVRTRTRDTVLVDSVRQSPVDAALSRRRRQVLALALVVLAALVVLITRTS